MSTQLELTQSAAPPTACPSPSELKYYDLTANWPKIEPLLSHPKVQETIDENYNRYCLGLLGIPFEGMTIEQLYELGKRTQYGDDWKQEGFDVRHGERQPYWVITCPGSCHWSANVNLEIAKLVEPGRPWRLISGEPHSTVWDGEDTLFETCYLAVGIDAQQCFDTAMIGSKPTKVGEQNWGGTTQPWWTPDGFKVENYKEWKWNLRVLQGIAENARLYLNNLTETFKRGQVDDDGGGASLAAIFDQTTQFIQMVKDERRTKAVKLLEQLSHKISDEAVEAVVQKINRTADSVLQQVNHPGRRIVLANPKEYIKDDEFVKVVSAYQISKSGEIQDVHDEKNEEPLASLRFHIFYATCFRWDWCLFVETDESPLHLWTFERFKASKREPEEYFEEEAAA